MKKMYQRSLDGLKKKETKNSHTKNTNTRWCSYLS